MNPNRMSTRTELRPIQNTYRVHDFEGVVFVASRGDHAANDALGLVAPMPERLVAGTSPPVDRDAYIDGLSNADWADLHKKLREYARKKRVPAARIGDIVQATCCREIDPKTRTYRPWKSKTFLDHLEWVLESEWKNVRSRACNRDLPLPEDDGDLAHESRDAVGISPEKLVVSDDLAIRAITKLFQLTPEDSLERRILMARAEGVRAPRHLAEKLEVPIKEIEAALKRLRRKEEEVALELGFESRKDMLVGAVPEAELLVSETPPASNGAIWTRLFVAASLATLATGTAWVFFGSTSLLVASFALAALLPIFWTARLYAAL
jgi:DNA-directed RNA polymerase specialized sigma24 family protein